MLRSILHQKYFYIVLTLIPIFMGIIGFLALLQSPYTGLHFKFENDKWYISSIDKDSPAARYPELKGMAIISIAGRKVEKWDLYHNPHVLLDRTGYFRFWETQKYFSEQIKADAVLSITVASEEKIRQIQIIPSHYPLVKALLEGWPAVIMVLLTILIGLVIVLKKPDDIVSKVFFFLMLSMVIYAEPYANYLLMDITYPYLLLWFLATLKSLSALSLAGSMIHLALIFPDNVDFFADKKLPVYIGYAFSSLYPVFYLAGYCKLASITSILTLPIVIGMFIYQYYSTKNPIKKLQSKWVLGGMVTASLIFLIYVIDIAVLPNQLITPMALLIFLNIFPLSIAFAIMKYKLMDIDTLFDNTLIYSITIGLLAMIDVAIVYILTSKKIPLLVFEGPFPTIIAVWVIIFAYLPVRNRVRDFIKKILKREIYDLNEVSTSYSKSLLSAYSTDDVVKMAQNAIERTLHPKNIEIELLDRHRELQPLINTEGGEAFIPLSANRGAIGLIALGEKHSGRVYDRNDVKLLDTIANQTALAIESIRHREGMRLKEEENRVEKERISKEIHDGIGSSLVQAKLLIDMAQKDPSKLPEASGIIDNGIKEMRELIWVVEQDEQTLGDLVYHIESRLEQMKGVMNVRIENNLEDENIILTPEQKLNLSRIVQESITNIIKHAQATRVNISFSQHDIRLKIIIRDNGKGFDASKTGSESYGLRNMKARAEKIGANLDISSETGKGSEIKLNMYLSGR